jgi:hypothetical protein
LGEVERLLRSGRRLPLVGRTLVDAVAILDVLDQIRASFPGELAQARRRLAEWEALLAEAHAEAEHLVWHAEQAAAERQQDQLLAEVAARVAEIEERALRQAAEIERSADQHAAESLRWLQAQLVELAQVLDRVRAEPRGTRAPGEPDGGRA